MMEDSPYADEVLDAGDQDMLVRSLMRRMAPHGSAQETIVERFPKMGYYEGAEIEPAMDYTPEPDPYSGMERNALQYFFRDLPKMTSEAGAAAWMADPTRSFSANVEDLRDIPPDPMETLKHHMTWVSGDVPLPETPQEYIDRVIGAMHEQGVGGPSSPLPPGVVPEPDLSDLYPMRKVSR